MVDDWTAFGGGFITYYLLIKNLNKACIAYTNGNYGEGSNENKMNENSYGVGTDEEEYDYEEDDDVTRTTPVLVGISGEYEGQELNISSGEEIVMGRDAQKCNLVFTSENVSKIHCRITFNFKENVYYVTDYSKMVYWQEEKRWQRICRSVCPEVHESVLQRMKYFS